MHADEADITAGLVHRLIADQFPEWSELPIRPVDSDSTVNAIFRLGTDMAVRLPRVRDGAGDLTTEQEWLPRLAPDLSLRVPTPLASGKPTEELPWVWSVYRWLDGERVTPARLSDPLQAARDLAAFVISLQRIDPTGAPSSTRAGPLRRQDSGVRSAIAELQSIGEAIDAKATWSAWEAALGTPDWDRPPVWIHGDLLPGNLLSVDGRLSAVLDFGCVSAGDPACESIPAWSLFDRDARETYRTELGFDDATWARGRGWALSIGLIALPYYRETNPGFAALARHIITEVLADQGR